MTRGTLEAKQAARRERVIRAAMELAAEGGYDAVQMRDVAARAGVALGTLYRYFNSKDQLLTAALAEWEGELEQNVRRRPLSGSAADRVVDVLRRATRAIERNPNLASAMIRGMTSPEVPRSSGTRHAVNNILAATMEAHDVRDREAIIHALGLVWFALVVQWMSGHRSAREMGDELETAARLLIR